MRVVALICVAGLLPLAACGDDDSDSSGSYGSSTTTEQAKKPAKPSGTEIVLRGSEFGSMLFGGKKQAIYIFERDSKGKTTCYDECAEAWPPVYTDGEPKAGKGVRQSLLGTVKRRGGKRQVTYADKPLYFYAHEDPGQVLCHNIFLYGGLWWVVGPDGKRRP